METIETVRELEERSEELYSRTRWLPRMIQHPPPDGRLVTTFHHVVPSARSDPRFKEIILTHRDPPAWKVRVPELRDLGSAVASRWPVPAITPLFELGRAPDGTWSIRFGPVLSWNREGPSLSGLVGAVVRELGEKPGDWKFH